MLILGVNAFHPDAAACVLLDGRVLAAAEEERFTRRKHSAGFPANAVRYVMQQAKAQSGACTADLDCVAINTEPAANRWHRLGFALRHLHSPRVLAMRIGQRRQRRDVLAAVAQSLHDDRLGAGLAHVEHHRAHLASAFYCSPYEHAAVVSVDGFGDFASAAWGLGQGDEIRVERRILFPHSLGIFYQAITQYLGFHQYGDEYKVMGLASYGKPNMLGPMGELLRLRDDGGFELNLRYFRHHRVALQIAQDDDSPRFPMLFDSAMAELLGPPVTAGAKPGQREMDIAHSAQVLFERALLRMLIRVQRDTGATSLAMAGGCAMNSVANGKILPATAFSQLFIQPAAGDAGGALGAALCAHRDWTGGLAREPMHHAALGPGYDTAQLHEVLEQYQQRFAQQGIVCTKIDDAGALQHQTAVAIADGAVVGWFQGRMEWGPRALGQRSILADPRRADMRDLLNRKIKRREEFRPFAPSIMREAVGQWFEIDDDVPYMMKVYPLRAGCAARVPAVAHVDGSARLQTVTREHHPLFHGLIAQFYEHTGVPMLLNTSFNENEPIVCQPDEAVECFLRTNMDRLVLGPYVISRTA
jgi:carbamoyltransferase